MYKNVIRDLFTRVYVYMCRKFYTCICVENLDLLDLFRNVQNPYDMQKGINNQIQNIMMFQR